MQSIQATQSLGTKDHATLYHGVYELRSALANHAKPTTHFQQ